LLAKDNGSLDPILERIKAVSAMEDHGAQVLVLKADVIDKNRMQEVLNLAQKDFGDINGVIHSAGVAGGRIMQLQSVETSKSVMAPKIEGTRILGELVAPLKLDFMVLCSSLASVLGVVGQVDYCSANAFQDAYAEYYSAKSGMPVISVNWDTWNESGMAVNAMREIGREKKDLKGRGFNNSEGVEVFKRILAAATVPQVAVSTYELTLLMPQRVTDIHSEKDVALVSGESVSPAPTENVYERPELSSNFVVAETQSQIQLSDIWKGLFKLNEIGIHDNFFELGGHSLLAIQAVAAIREDFNTSISIDKFLELGTIAKMASHIDALEWVKSDAAEKFVGDDTRDEFEL
jgi:NADP-dependent 3-hydroxy acid dehydrogenase YdfG/acyl carrier protein